MKNWLFFIIGLFGGTIIGTIDGTLNKLAVAAVVVLVFLVANYVMPEQKESQQRVQLDDDNGKPHVGIPCIYCGALPTTDDWVCHRR